MEQNFDFSSHVGDAHSPLQFRNPSLLNPAHTQMYAGGSLRGVNHRMRTMPSILESQLRGGNATDVADRSGSMQYSQAIIPQESDQFIGNSSKSNWETSTGFSMSRAQGQGVDPGKPKAGPKATCNGRRSGKTASDFKTKEEFDKYRAGREANNISAQGTRDKKKVQLADKTKDIEDLKKEISFLRQRLHQAEDEKTEQSHTIDQLVEDKSKVIDQNSKLIDDNHRQSQTIAHMAQILNGQYEAFCKGKYQQAVVRKRRAQTDPMGVNRLIEDDDRTIVDSAGRTIWSTDRMDTNLEQEGRAIFDQPPQAPTSGSMNHSQRPVDQSIQQLIDSNTTVGRLVAPHALIAQYQGDSGAMLQYPTAPSNGHPINPNSVSPVVVLDVNRSSQGLPIQPLIEKPFDQSSRSPIENSLIQSSIMHNQAMQNPINDPLISHGQQWFDQQPLAKIDSIQSDVSDETMAEGFAWVLNSADLLNGIDCEFMQQLLADDGQLLAQQTDPRWVEAHVSREKSMLGHKDYKNGDQNEGRIQ